jgi:hypothetical protein
VNSNVTEYCRIASLLALERPEWTVAAIDRIARAYLRMADQCRADLSLPQVQGIARGQVQEDQDTGILFQILRDYSEAQGVWVLRINLAEEPLKEHYWVRAPGPHPDDKERWEA